MTGRHVKTFVTIFGVVSLIISGILGVSYLGSSGHPILAMVIIVSGLSALATWFLEG